jgi:hypothetical protein
MAFDGLATYDQFPIIGESISDIIRLLSPTETPLLDRLPAPDNPATNVLHQWTEEELGPDFVINSTAINSEAAGTQSPVRVNGLGNTLQVGMEVELEGGVATQEVARISSILGANTIVLKRGLNGSISSLAAGGQLFVISTAEEEGSDTVGDVSRPRTRRENYTQIFKKPIKVSGSQRSVLSRPDIGDEFDHQVVNRAAELLRDLEKSVVRGALAGNSIGGDDAVRTLKGLRSWLTSINSTIANNSFAANPLFYVNSLLQESWNAGGTDLNVLYVGQDWKRDLSATNEAKLQVSQTERGIERLADFIITDFGTLELVLARWLPRKHMMGLSTGRIFVRPLRGRSFFREEIAKTGDSTKGHVIGEYTVEIHQPDKMFQARTSAT